MNDDQVKRIADAVLYEGYILYPYRPSVKNRQRWTFGGLLPETYCRTQNRGDSWSCQAECLVQGTDKTAFDVRVRFLHLMDRRVGAIDPPVAEWPPGEGPPFQSVQSLRVGKRLYQSWQEAEQREIPVESLQLRAIAEHSRCVRFAFPRQLRHEPLRDEAGKIVGVLARQQDPLEGRIEITATVVEDELFRVRVRVENQIVLDDPARCSRDDALLRSLVSTHAILYVRDGEFVSLLDPPDACREAAAACRNVGLWPVLVSDEGEKDTMLASPIILYDYPQIAPESPGDLFDGTEIDEILTLRVLTLTDEEKEAAAAVDERAGELLRRTESLAREQLLGLHGAMRRPLA
jgi:hydrogenase maturation protease